MTIIDYFLREKHMQLIAAKDNNMMIAIKNPEAVLVKEEDSDNTKDFVKKFILNICNEKEEIIASFSVSYQFKIKFEKNEKYDEISFFKLICPVLYNSISSMMLEFDLPKLSIQAFFELATQTD